MENKPILILAGEPNSIFSEIFIKSLNRIKVKKPIIFISSKKLMLNIIKIKLSRKYLVNQKNIFKNHLKQHLK